jgi:hypothetical protein
MQLFYNNDTFRAFICPDPICPTSPARPIGSLQQNISNLSLARASRPPLFSLFLSRMPLALLPLSLRCRRASRCAGSSLPPLFSLSCALVLLPLLSLSAVRASVPNTVAQRLGVASARAGHDMVARATLDTMA